MKQTIRQVLDDMKDSQINLGSEAARETIASLVSAALKTKGTYTELDDSEIENKLAQEDWVCDVCNESTYYVDNDYIGSGTNHLQCELKLELEEEVIGGRVEFEEPETRVVDDAGVDIETGTYIGGSEEIDGAYTPDEYEGWEEAVKKESLQKQAYMEMTSDGLPEGGDVQAVLESHKLADEIVDNKNEKWIYESPDGGKTVFRRPFSDYDPSKKEEIDWETKEPTGRKFTEYNNGNWSNEDEG